VYKKQTHWREGPSFLLISEIESLLRYSSAACFLRMNSSSIIIMLMATNEQYFKERERPTCQRCSDILV